MKTRYLPVVVGTALGSDRVGLLENVIFEKVSSAEEASKAVAIQNLFFLSDKRFG